MRERLYLQIGGKVSIFTIVSNFDEMIEQIEESQITINELINLTGSFMNKTKIKKTEKIDNCIKNLQWIIDNKVTLNYVRKVALLDTISILQDVKKSEEKE